MLLYWRVWVNEKKIFSDKGLTLSELGLIGDIDEELLLGNTLNNIFILSFFVMK